MLKNNLKEIRIKKGLTQQEVARALGIVSSDRISHWENGTAYPSIQNLFKLARIYEFNIEELYKLIN